MGEKLEAYYREAESLGGIKGKMRLAILTGIPSARAGIRPDSDENIRKFQDGLQEIRKEFK